MDSVTEDMATPPTRTTNIATADLTDGLGLANGVDQLDSRQGENWHSCARRAYLLRTGSHHSLFSASAYFSSLSVDAGSSFQDHIWLAAGQKDME